MKILTTLLLTLVLISTSFAQSSGIIQYTEAIKLDVEMDGMDDEILAMIPKAQTIEKILLFTSNEAHYDNAKGNQDLEISHKEGDNEFEFNFAVPENSIYVNSKTNEYINSQDFLGKRFLIVDELGNRKWKVTGEQKKVLDYVCVQAILDDEEQDVVAWFSPSIKNGFGPMGYTGLPGMILALEIDGDKVKVVAQNINLESDNIQIERPTKGKRVNREEFEKIRDEKMKEMGAEVDGEGGAVRMIIIDEDRG